VAHSYSGGRDPPRYLGGRDQEDHYSKLAWANSLLDPISKKKPIKRGGGWWSDSDVGPKFKPQYHKKKKKRKRKKHRYQHNIVGDLNTKLSPIARSSGQKSQ
jgi:hypothetical protein